MYAHVPNATEEDPALLNVQAADDLQDQGLGVHVRVGRGRIEDFLLFHEPIVHHRPCGQKCFTVVVVSGAEEMPKGQQISGWDEPAPAVPCQTDFLHEVNHPDLTVTLGFHHQSDHIVVDGSAFDIGRAVGGQDVFQGCRAESVHVPDLGRIGHSEIVHGAEDGVKIIFSGGGVLITNAEFSLNA